MFNLLSTFSPQVIAAAFISNPVLLEALRISGIALLAIFFVMGLFGVMINLFSVLFPASEDEVS